MHTSRAGLAIKQPLVSRYTGVTRTAAITQAINMPKAPPNKVAKSARQEPLAKPETKAKAPAKVKDPKASHLYTDDNPSTTIHGTGFKDEAAALRTLDLIFKRSLIYQFQTVNTMYNRAKHHPAMKKAVEGSAGTADMRKAMEVFREWLDVTYPAQKGELRAEGFKPLLSKKAMQKHLSSIDEDRDVSEDAKAFARVYVELAKGKKLGNVLVDDSKPTEVDWERKRYDVLNQLVPQGEEGGEKEWKLSELWTDERKPTALHLEMIAWAWSPVRESKLA